MLLLASSGCGLFKWRQFEPEMILLAVGWYLRFSQRYAPELERRLRSRLNSTNDSWRVDETYIRVKGKWVLATCSKRLHSSQKCIAPANARCP
jgi:transposase-like protein